MNAFTRRGVSLDWLNDGRRLMFNGQSDDRSLIFPLDTESGIWMLTLGDQE